MKKRGAQESTQQFIETWWTTQEPFPIFACADAEGFFLSFLFFLATHKKFDPSIRTPQQVSVMSHDLKLVESGNAIQKQTIDEGGILSRLSGNTKRYTFGEQTYLVVSGPLAGTIAFEVSPVNLGLIEKNKVIKGTTPIVAIRPFHRHQRIGNNLHWRTDEKRYFGKTAHELRHSREVYRLFMKSNPMALLLQWLTDAKIPHDSDTMLKNAVLWEGRQTQ